MGDWDEDAHPRGENGQFGAGGGDRPRKHDLPEGASAEQHYFAAGKASNDSIQMGVNSSQRGDLLREAAEHHEKAAAGFEKGDIRKDFARDYAMKHHKEAATAYRDAAKEAGYRGEKDKVAEFKALAKEHADKHTAMRNDPVVAREKSTAAKDASAEADKAAERGASEKEQIVFHEAAHDAHVEASKQAGLGRAMQSIHKSEAKGHTRAIGELRSMASSAMKRWAG